MVESGNLGQQTRVNTKRFFSNPSAPNISARRIPSDECGDKLSNSTRNCQSRSEMFDKRSHFSSSIHKAKNFHRILKDVNTSTKKLEEETIELLDDLVSSTISDYNKLTENNFYLTHILKYNVLLMVYRKNGSSDIVYSLVTNFKKYE